ncbi:alpha/beta hydrolase [Cohnella endophytica]|uniref:Alpha/beta hydrolase n=1 Tax=Cohnella endophytica TaxID=2419778 RepID=A0A494Y954_9BACL|nr:alpha/beta hydrolase [Cohnella endophytica]RKP56848.1 alpha/beta hydrolase [Cohnella endophytica]
MNLDSRFAENGEVIIHYLCTVTDSQEVPLLICPGLSETAEEYEDLMEYLYPRPCVVLSFRGRGLSSTPSQGYALEHHLSDLEAVVRDAQLERFHLYAYSRGVSYGLAFMERYPRAVLSAILQDYPAEHKQMPSEWAEDYIENYLIPFSRELNIRPEAVRGIQKESVQRTFEMSYGNQLLVLRGLLADSLLKDEGLRPYRNMNPQVIVESFDRSGHAIRNSEKDKLYRMIRDFIQTS